MKNSEFLEAWPLELLIHNNYLDEVRNILLEVSRDHGITWRELTDRGDDLTGIEVRSYTTGFAFTYYVVGLKLGQHFGNKQIGIFAEVGEEPEPDRCRYCESIATAYPVVKIEGVEQQAPTCKDHEV